MLYRNVLQRGRVRKYSPNTAAAVAVVNNIDAFSAAISANVGHDPNIDFSSEQVQARHYAAAQERKRRALGTLNKLYNNSLRVDDQFQNKGKNFVKYLN